MHRFATRLIAIALLACASARAQTPTSFSSGNSISSSAVNTALGAKCDVAADSCIVTPTGGTSAPLSTLLSRVNLGNIALSAIAAGNIDIGDSTATNYGIFARPNFRVATRGGANAIVGIADNNTTSGTTAFPTGTTGYGNLSSAGGTVFGLFGRADLRSSGTATNEVNAFNYCGNPSTTLPPNTSFGSTECNAIPLQVIPYGNYNSSIGMLFGPGVNDASNAPIFMRTAVYFRPNSFYGYGFYVDGSATDTAPAVILTRGGTGQHITMSSVGTGSPSSPIISYTNSSGVNTFSVDQAANVSGSGVNLTPTTYALLSSPTAGRVLYCSDCFQPGTSTRGTLVFGTGAAWMAVSSAAVTH